MADRYFPSTPRVMQNSPVMLYVKYTAVDNGTCTLASAPFNRGITSVVESGTGVITITLQDKYTALAAVHGTVDDASTTSDKVYFEVNSSTNVQATTPIIVLQSLANNTAKNITANNNVNIVLHLLNSGE